MSKIAIIGAGITGAAAAHALVSRGMAVIVFDKSRGSGGRLATRRGPAGAFDHGAPAVQGGADPGFDVAMRSLDTVEDHPSLDGWRGVPGMSGLVKPLLAGVMHCPGRRVVGISRDRRIELADRETTDAFDAVLVAIPAPQAAELLPSLDLGPVAMAPCWTLMAAWDVSGQPADDPPIPFQSVIAQRGGAGWIAHAQADWSRANLERPAEEVAADLARRLGDVLGAGRRPRHATAHRWRYARCERPLGAPFARAGEGILAGGDWALGPNAGHAWESGRAMAAAALADLPRGEGSR